MDLTIRQSCPSCGAEIELHEADRLIRCPYCDVRNFMVTRGPLRFVLPDKVPSHIPRSDIFYAPYLRFKGNVFYCKGKHLKFKVVDTTLQGINVRVLPPSLGFRPQAMAVSIVTADVQGIFLRQTIKASVLLDRAAFLTVIDSEEIDAPFYHRAYIGETLSCIYLPLYVDHDVLYDGVTNKPLAEGGSEEKMKAMGIRYRESWTPHFLATLCPHCGDSLTGERDSLILSCYNCHSSWEECKGKFRSIPWSCVVSGSRRKTYLPFWKLTVRASGTVLETFADFLRITNQPFVIQPKHKARELVFFLPAFKVRPSTFLRLSKNMTLRQETFSPGEQQMQKNMHPVTLPRIEAVQALKSVLAGSALNKKKLLPILPQLHFHPQQTELSYLPFLENGHDLIQEQNGISIAQSVLRFGRKL